MAREKLKKIVLPEGDEPRTVESAILSCERGIAAPILLAKKTKVEKVAEELGLRVPAGVEIIDPEQILESYVEPLVELRKHKGLTPEKARELLQDPIYIGTMMLHLGEADGLVSGAVHTSANTVKPALQIIKCKKGVDTVSSIFFMCLPSQVLIYGDCAVVQDPTAEQLASIAIQAAENAKAFNIPQRIAMVSYSTGNSGTGADVDKVRRATQLVRERRPELCIDGPLQYDAAVIDSVAAKKAPDSPVAGKATILIFPDLNTGNITYKAVQRSAHVVSIGPMLQGLKKPVNDLSRGALVDDIIYTSALTAIQARQDEIVKSSNIMS
jgi:phosphate acetyltransferase